MNPQSPQMKPSGKFLTDLMTAAMNGDVEFLKHCHNTNLPHDYYLTNFAVYYPGNVVCHKNIFHQATECDKTEFIRKAIEILPPNVSQKLLVQQQTPDLLNPLHIAALCGGVEILKLFLDFCCNHGYSSQPWLQQDVDGCTPCHSAISKTNEECALEILRMDPVKISNIIDNDGNSVLYHAMDFKLLRFVLEIVKSNHPFSCSGIDGFTALHRVPILSAAEGEEFFKQLLQKVPHLIKPKTSSGHSLLEIWADMGKVWQFKCILESSVISRDDKKVLVDLISSTSGPENYNPIHSLVAKDYTSESNEEELVDIANLLINTYKKEIAVEASSSNPRDSLPWLTQGINGFTPLLLAMHNGFESFATNILSMDTNALQINGKINGLHYAIEKGYDTVALKMLKIIEDNGWIQIFTIQDNVNVLHIAPKCKAVKGLLMDLTKIYKSYRSFQI